MLAGGLGLGGWALSSNDVVGVPAWFAAIGGAALPLTLAGLALRLLISQGNARRVAQFVAGLTMLLGLFAISQKSPGSTPAAGLLGLGQSPLTAALNALMLGCALLLAGTRANAWFAHALTLAGALLSLFVCIIYAHQSEALVGIAEPIGVGLPAAVLGLLLCIGILCAYPHVGLMAIMTSATAGGAMLRQLLPAAIGLPVAIGWLLAGQRIGLHEARFDLAIIVAASIAVSLFVIWWGANSLHFVDLERQRAEATLRASEARFRTLLGAAPDAIVIISDDGCITLINSEAERMFGYPQAELLGRPVELLLPERLRARHAQHRAAFSAAPHARPMGSGFDLVGRRKDGSELSVEISLSPVAAPEGSLVIAGLRDITDRKRAEAALRASEVRFRTSVETMLDGFAILAAVRDDAGAIVDFRYDYINDAGCRLNLRPRAEQVGHTLLELLPAHRDVGLLNEYAQLVEDGRPLIKEALIYEDVYGGGKRLQRAFDIRAVRLGDGFAVSWRDVTERKQSEEELEQRVSARTAQLEFANRELEAFSYSISHDLRAPLRAIDGFSRILLDDYALHVSPDIQRYLQLIRKNTQQMGRLIDDLLAFSRLSRQPLAKKSVALAGLVSQALVEAQGDCVHRRIEITIGDLPPCQGDPGLLKQVWVNLLANALKFTRGREPAMIAIDARYDPDQPNIPIYFIKDNGVGFDMRYAHKLFGVFQRLHRAEDYEGTGVGLALVQRIIHRHGGRIWAEAAPNQGATFFFTLGGTMNG